MHAIGGLAHLLRARFAGQALPQLRAEVLESSIAAVQRLPEPRELLREDAQALLAGQQLRELLGDLGDARVPLRERLLRPTALGLDLLADHPQLRQALLLGGGHPRLQALRHFRGVAADLGHERGHPLLEPRLGALQGLDRRHGAQRRELLSQPRHVVPHGAALGTRLLQEGAAPLELGGLVGDLLREPGALPQLGVMLGELRGVLDQLPLDHMDAGKLLVDAFLQGIELQPPLPLLGKLPSLRDAKGLHGLLCSALAADPEKELQLLGLLFKAALQALRFVRQGVLGLPSFRCLGFQRRSKFLHVFLHVGLESALLRSVGLCGGSELLQLFLQAATGKSDLLGDPRRHLRHPLFDKCLGLDPKLRMDRVGHLVDAVVESVGAAGGTRHDGRAAPVVEAPGVDLPGETPHTRGRQAAAAAAARRRLHRGGAVCGGACGSVGGDARRGRAEAPSQGGALNESVGLRRRTVPLLDDLQGAVVPGHVVDLRALQQGRRRTMPL
mmetsp:Transcript_110769/g.320069  ORF Transcript_110769/g.320069 Transcript_110769/m.320069 type:complete len:500 (+) Transcript_110769:686-2185(+)